MHDGRINDQNKGWFRVREGRTLTVTMGMDCSSFFSFAAADDERLRPGDGHISRKVERCEKYLQRGGEVVLSTKYAIPL
jgi:hypothetical protein